MKMGGSHSPPKNNLIWDSGEIKKMETENTIKRDK
jgi:hypothetical protein